MTVNQITLTSVVLAIVSIGQMCRGEYQELSWVMDMNHISYYPAFSDPKYQFIYTIQQKGPYANLDHEKTIKYNATNRNGLTVSLDFSVAFNSYSTVEHMGTHIDAPYHFDPNGKFMDQVPLQDLIGPLVRIDITGKAKQNKNAAVSIQDLTAWEEENGQIPDKSFVLMYSGWDQYYGNQELYIGVSSTLGRPSYPGFSGEASKWLLENRNILGVGVDSVGCDIGQDSEFPVHIHILYAGKLCIENLRNLDKVPASGARLAALPIMMKNGTGTQARVFAEWGTDMTTTKAKAMTLQWSVILAVISVCVALCVN